MGWLGGIPKRRELNAAPAAATGQPLVLLLTTAPISLWAFFSGQVAFMRGMGLEVQALSSPGPFLHKFSARERVQTTAVEMPRRISPRRDVIALVGIMRAMRRVRPTIVHAHTPKAGLLGMLAATIVRVPVRVYHIHGLPMMTATGPRRALLKASEWLSCRLAHQVLCVSHSLGAVAIAEGLCAGEKIKVPANGTINGIDATGCFNPDRFDAAHRLTVRASLGIPHDALVLGYVGRMVRDKGIDDLAHAWRSLRDEVPHLHLLLVGPEEPQDPISPETRTLLRSDSRIHLTGPVDDPAPLYAVMDVVVLPTYREGFPLVPLEAAAMRLPVVASRVPGCIDAIEDGSTGTLVEPGEIKALRRAILTYIGDPMLRSRHGEAGRQRALADFRPPVVWEATYQVYRRLLHDRCAVNLLQLSQVTTAETGSLVPQLGTTWESGQ